MPFLTKRHTPLLLCLAALTACSVGPDYHTPTPQTPTHFHQSVAPSTAHTTEATLTPQWWTLYNDPILTQLETAVAQNNLDLRTASLNFEESTAERRIAAAAQLPRLDGAASYARERASTNGILSLLGTTQQSGPGEIASGGPGFGPAAADGAKGNPAFNLPQFGMSASWELDFWGHVRRQVEAATAAMRATADMQRNILVSLMAETAQNYIALRNIQAQITITQQSIDISRRSVHLTELRFNQGTATRLDVAYSRGQMHDFEARLPVLRSQEVHLINALSVLVAREPGALTALLQKPGAIPPVPSILPTGLPSELTTRRPDVQAAEERLHAATANIGVAIADFFPRIALSGSLDIQALQFSGLGSWASRQYGFGPTMTLPLFEGGRLRGQLHLRKTQQKEAAIALQKTLLHAWEEVDDAMTDLSTAQERQKRLEESVTENETAVHIAQLQYSQGAGDFLNVLTTQNALLSSRSALSEARAGVSVSVAHLYRSLGGGWEH